MSTETNDAPSELEKKIIKQVEYYFGDINVSKDKFLQQETQKDSGWVSLKVLTTFNRLKQLSDDTKVILAALKKSTSDLLEIDAENEKIRRSKSLPENLSEFENAVKQNTVYVKGFPATITLDELLAFFQTFGNPISVFMRRLPATKQFKGSVFVTFESSEQVKALLEADAEKVKYGDQTLIRESQEDYFKRKAPQLEKYKEEKQKKDQEKEDKKKKLQEAEEAFMKEQQILGAVINVKGLSKEGSREKLKELFDNHAKVKWIEYNRGEEEANIIFVEADSAKGALEKAREANGGHIKFSGEESVPLEAKVLEGEEEQAFWKAHIKERMDKKNKPKARGGRGGGGRGGYGNKGGYNGNKRRNDEENGGHEHKKAKADNGATD